MLQPRWPRMCATAFAMIALACVFASGCDRAALSPTAHSAPSSSTIRLEVRDTTYRLTRDERASVRPGFNVDALQLLLSHVEPAVRPVILSGFQAANIGERSTALVKVGDPALQPLLDEVWASSWDAYPQSVKYERKQYPGLELARHWRALGQSPR